MSKDKSNAGSRSEVSEQPEANDIAERRKRLAHQIGRLLARNCLRQRRLTEEGKPPSGDSQNDPGA